MCSGLWSYFQYNNHPLFRIVFLIYALHKQPSNSVQVWLHSFCQKPISQTLSESSFTATKPFKLMSMLQRAFLWFLQKTNTVMHDKIQYVLSKESTLADCLESDQIGFSGLLGTVSKPCVIKFYQRTDCPAGLTAQKNLALENTTLPCNRNSTVQDHCTKKPNPQDRHTGLPQRTAPQDCPAGSPHSTTPKDHTTGLIHRNAPQGGLPHSTVSQDRSTGPLSRPALQNHPTAYSSLYL